MSTRTEPIGFGVIGVGIWGELHVRVLSDDPRVRLVAVCDLNKEKARAIADKYGVKKVYSSYEEMLRDPEVEAVSIATPDFAHGEPALAVLQAKRHLLIEKPMTTTVEEGIAIVNAARKSGVTLMVDLHNRWSPPFMEAYNNLKNGDLGELEFVWFRLSDTIFVPTKSLPWAGKSSVLWFLGPHIVDTVRWLYHDEVKEVYAVSRKNTLAKMGIDTPDFYSVILQFEKGGVATLEMSWIVAAGAPSIFDLKCELLGSKGTVFIDTSNNRMIEVYTEKTLAGSSNGPYKDTTLMPIIHGRQVGFATESIRHFLDCIWNGKEPLVGGIDGLRATEILVAAEESIASGLPVKVTRNLI